jgi:uncharacterized protein
MKSDHGVVLSNTFSRACLALDEDDYQRLGGYLGTSHPILHDASDPVLSFLKNNGFLVPADYDELGFLKLLHRASRFANNHLGIAILLTLDCNFRCSYCYEVHSKIRMQHEVREAVIKYIRSEALKRACIEVGWFGGEPLLEADELCELGHRISTICEHSLCKYRSSIATNGYLLSRDLAGRLKSAGVTDAQITVDGYTSHNKNRRLANGQPTYQVVVANIVDASTVLDHINVRLNVLNQSFAECKRLLSDLVSARDRVTIDVHPVSVFGPDGCSAWGPDSEHYFALSQQIYTAAHDMGFRIDPIHCSLIKPFYCAAYSPNYVIINPDGAVHNCIVEVSKEHRSFGRLRSDGTLEVDYQHGPDDFIWDCFEDPDCVKCNVLPLCMGGCLRYPRGLKETAGRCELRHDTARQLFLAATNQKRHSLREGQQDQTGGQAHTLST